MFEPKIDLIKDQIGKLRIAYDVDGQPWFLLKDVGTCLKIGNPRDRLQKLIDDGRIKAADRASISYRQCMDNGLEMFWKSISTGKKDLTNKTFISEYAIYALAYSTGSKIKKVREFQQWISHTVLPNINHNGGYILGQEKLDKKSQDLLIEKIKELEKLVAEKEKSAAKLKSYITETDELNEKLVAETVQLYAQIDRLSKNSVKECKKIMASAPQVTGKRYSVSIKDSLVHFEDENKGKYAIKDFPDEK